MLSIGAWLRYRINRIKARVGVVLLRRAARKEKGWIDRLFTRILAWVTNSSPSKENDFMRDELVDSEVELDPNDLAAYQKQSKQSESK